MKWWSGKTYVHNMRPGIMFSINEGGGPPGNVHFHWRPGRWGYYVALWNPKKKDFWRWHR